MIVLQSVGSIWNNPYDSFILLANLGYLHAYDGASTSQYSLATEEDNSPISLLPVPIQA